MPAIWTTEGTAWLNERIGNPNGLGDLYATPGEGRFDPTVDRDVLADPVQGSRPAGITFPGGNILALPITDVDVVTNAGVVTHRRFRFIDTDLTRAYNATEVGIWAVRNNVAFMIIYWSDTSPFPKVANATFEYPVLVGMSGVPNPTFTVTNTISGIGDATANRKGAVQHVTTAGSYAQGDGFVLTPAQVQALVSAAGSSLEKASSTEINTGTDNAKFITAAGLRGSRYVQNYIQNRAPNSSDGSNGDTWDRY